MQLDLNQIYIIYIISLKLRRTITFIQKVRLINCDKKELFLYAYVQIFISHFEEYTETIIFCHFNIKQESYNMENCCLKIQTNPIRQNYATNFVAENFVAEKLCILETSQKTCFQNFQLILKHGVYWKIVKTCFLDLQDYIKPFVMGVWVKNLNWLITSAYSTKETFPHNFLVIQKRQLQNYQKVLKKCLLVTYSARTNDCIICHKG